MIWLGLGLGFVLGLRHAFEPDHLAAVSTQIVKEKKWMHGLKHSLAWSLGHALVLFLGGVTLLMLELTLPPKIELVIELLIGVLLVMVGFYSFREKKSISTKKTFMIGSAHGLAGSSALVLLITTSFATVSERLEYIIIFGVGSMIGMLIVAGMLCLFQKTYPAPLGGWVKISDMFSERKNHTLSLIPRRLRRLGFSFQKKKSLGLQRTAAVMSIVIGIGIIMVKGMDMIYSLS